MNGYCDTAATQQNATSVATSITTNLSNETEYCRLPDIPYHPLPLSVLITVIHLILLIVGTIGNVATLVIIYTNRRFRSRTNIMLCNLALSDMILLSLGVIFDLFVFWRPLQPFGGNWFCFFKAFLIETVTNVSVMTITAIAADRWFAICRRPFELPEPINHKRIIALITGIWVFAVCGAFPHAYQYSVVPIPCDNVTSEIPLCDSTPTLNRLLVLECAGNLTETQYGQCDIRPQHRITNLTEILSVIFFFMPMTCIACGYGFVMWELHTSLKTFDEIPDCSSCLVATQVSDKRSLIRIIFAVMFIFFISHLPLHIQRLLTLNFKQEWQCNHAVMDFLYALFILAAIFHFFSATSNPYLYLIFSRRFRLAFQRLCIKFITRLCSCCRGSHNLTQGSQNQQPKKKIAGQHSKWKSTPNSLAKVTTSTSMSTRKKFTMKLQRRFFNSSHESDIRLSWSRKAADTCL